MHSFVCTFVGSSDPGNRDGGVKSGSFFFLYSRELVCDCGNVYVFVSPWMQYHTTEWCGQLSLQHLLFLIFRSAVFSIRAWIQLPCTVCRVYFDSIFIGIYAVSHCNSLIIVWACRRQLVLVIRVSCQPFAAQILIMATIMHCIMARRRPKALYWVKRGEAQLSHRIRFCKRHLSYTTQTQTAMCSNVFPSLWSMQIRKQNLFMNNMHHNNIPKWPTTLQHNTFLLIKLNWMCMNIVHMTF